MNFFLANERLHKACSEIFPVALCDKTCELLYHCAQPSGVVRTCPDVGEHEKPMKKKMSSLTVRKPEEKGDSLNASVISKGSWVHFSGPVCIVAIFQGSVPIE